MPVIRDADAMSFAEIEHTIADFGRRVRDGALKLEDLTGGVQHHQRRLRLADVDADSTTAIRHSRHAKIRIGRWQSPENSRSGQ